MHFYSYMYSLQMIFQFNFVQKKDFMSCHVCTRTANIMTNAINDLLGSWIWIHCSCKLKNSTSVDMLLCYDVSRTPFHMGAVCNETKTYNLSEMFDSLLPRIKSSILRIENGIPVQHEHNRVFLFLFLPLCEVLFSPAWAPGTSLVSQTSSAMIPSDCMDHQACMHRVYE